MRSPSSSKCSTEPLKEPAETVPSFGRVLLFFFFWIVVITIRVLLVLAGKTIFLKNVMWLKALAMIHDMCFVFKIKMFYSLTETVDFPLLVLMYIIHLFQSGVLEMLTIFLCVILCTGEKSCQRMVEGHMSIILTSFLEYIKHQRHFYENKYFFNNLQLTLLSFTGVSNSVKKAKIQNSAQATDQCLSFI